MRPNLIDMVGVAAEGDRLPERRRDAGGEVILAFRATAVVDLDRIDGGEERLLRERGDIETGRERGTLRLMDAIEVVPEGVRQDCWPAAL